MQRDAVELARDSEPHCIDSRSQECRLTSATAKTAAALSRFATRRGKQGMLTAKITKKTNIDVPAAIEELGRAMLQHNLGYPELEPIREQIATATSRIDSLRAESGLSALRAKPEILLIQRTICGLYRQAAEATLGHASENQEHWPEEVRARLHAVRILQKEVVDLESACRNVGEQIKSDSSLTIAASELGRVGLTAAATVSPKRRKQLIIGGIVVVLLAASLLMTATGNEQVKNRSGAQVPAYDAALQRGISSFDKGMPNDANNAFFDAEQIARKQHDEDFKNSYNQGDWSERVAKARLGRAAAVIVAGDNDAAKAIIRSAYEESTRASFPVASAIGERLLAEAKEQSRSSQPEDTQMRTGNSIRNTSSDSAPKKGAKLVTGHGSDFQNGYVHGYGTGEALARNGSADRMRNRAQSDPYAFRMDLLPHLPSGTSDPYQNGFMEGCVDSLNGRGPKHN